MIFRFLHPWFFLLLLLIPAVVALHLWIEKRRKARIVFSDLTPFKDIAPSGRVRMRYLPLALRMLAVTALVVALARPQYGNRTQEITSKGIDIMLVLDNSMSMKQPDLEPTRLDAAKKVIQSFIQGREEGMQNDRIGLVVFSQIAFTKCPLTVDYTILKKIVNTVDFTRPEFNRTAIGTALATAVGRMEDSKAKSKVIIMVTDGENNAGLDPMTAASMAEALKIKVYPIGVVPEGFMTKTVDRIFGMKFVPRTTSVDETQMKNIADMTGGKYFRATDEEALEKVFQEIDRMERTEVKVKEFYRYSERYWPWAGLALLLVFFEIVISRTIMRRIP